MGNLDEKARMILSLIDEGMSINQISYLLNISNKEIYYYLSLLRFNGFNVLEKYYANGDTGYELIKNAKFKDKLKNTIITEHSSNEFDLLIVSDFHLGSLYERYDLIRDIYINYCLQNDIHIVLNIGDLVEGVVNLPNIKIPWDEQLNKALSKLPYVDNILTFLLLGNHDHNLLTTYGQNIRDAIKNIRNDIIPLGYGQANLKIKNDELILQHPLMVKEYTNGMFDRKVIIRGHGHASKIKMDGNNYIIYAPSLSDLNFHKSEYPGAIKMHIKMHLGKIQQVGIDELTYINKKLHTTSEIYFYVGAWKKLKEGEIISNEEDYPKVLKKV